MLVSDGRGRVSESLGGLQSWTGWTGHGTVEAELGVPEHHGRCHSQLRDLSSVTWPLWVLLISP